MTLQEIAVFGPALLIWCLALYSMLDPYLEQAPTETWMIGRSEVAGVALSSLGAVWLSVQDRNGLWMGTPVAAWIVILFANQLRRSLRSLKEKADEWMPLAEGALALLAMVAAYSFAKTLAPMIPEAEPWRGKLCLALSALLFLAVGATYLVRAVLAYTGYDPGQNLGKISAKEFRVGKVIGMAERWIACALVASGQYEALGILLAAKGLVRSKELENGQVSNYVILGSLTSLGLAMLVGELLRRGLSVAP